MRVVTMCAALLLSMTVLAEGRSRRLGVLTGHCSRSFDMQGRLSHHSGLDAMQFSFQPMQNHEGHLRPYSVADAGAGAVNLFLCVNNHKH